jgi:hypothetical protein
MAIGRKMKRPLGQLMQIAIRHGDREQPSPLGAADLDRPAPPLSVNFDTQLKSDELCQLKCPCSRRKFAHPNMTLRVLRARKSKTILGHGEPGAGRMNEHRYKGCPDDQLRQ